MKKRFIGIVHLSQKGEGVIDIISEETPSSLMKIEQQYKAMAVAKSPSKEGAVFNLEVARKNENLS
jgi:hypothetical protein